MEICQVSAAGEEDHQATLDLHLMVLYDNNRNKTDLPIAI